MSGGVLNGVHEDGQTIYAKSLYIVGRSGGSSSVRNEIREEGAADAVSQQNIMLSGVVEGEDVGLLMQAFDDGQSFLVSHNLSEDLEGLAGVQQEPFPRIGLTQNVTVLEGYRWRF